jgi:hypothetical protein
MIHIYVSLANPSCSCPPCMLCMDHISVCTMYFVHISLFIFRIDAVCAPLRVFLCASRVYEAPCRVCTACQSFSSPSCMLYMDHISLYCAYFVRIMFRVMSLFVHHFHVSLCLYITCIHGTLYSRRPKDMQVQPARIRFAESLRTRCQAAGCKCLRLIFGNEQRSLDG